MSAIIINIYNLLQSHDMIKNLEIGLCLRRKHILVIGTNRANMLAYIRDKFKVPSSPSNFVHSNTVFYITERKVETLNMNDLLIDLNNHEYDEVIFYSTIHNIDILNQLNIDEKLKRKLKLVSYIQ